MISDREAFLFDIEIFFIFSPIAIFILMIFIYGIKYLIFSNNLKKIAGIFSGQIDLETPNMEIIGYPSIVYDAGYKEGRSSVVSFRLTESIIGKVFFIHKSIPSAWSFYSTVLVISDSSLNHLNLLIAKNPPSEFNVCGRELRRRNCNFIESCPAELFDYREIISYCFSKNRKVAIDVYQGNFVVLFYGMFFSNILKADEIKLICDKRRSHRAKT